MDIGTYQKRYANRPEKLLVSDVQRLEARYQQFSEQLSYSDPRLADALNEWQGASAALEALRSPERKR